MTATFCIAEVTPRLAFDFPFKTALVLAVGLVGVTLNLLPKLSFKRADTTVNPLRPGGATHLVTTGIYRYTRNPMYLGYALILSGWALYLGKASGVAGIAIFVVFITRFQIRPEERTLHARFPEYAAYCQQVSRWL